MSFRLFFIVAICTLGVLGGQAPSSQADEQAPESYQVEFETSAGNFTVEVTRKWAPNGADRFYELVQKEFYKECRFFRVIPGFMVQWGIHSDPGVQKNWRGATIPDDPTVASNQKGFITFAKTSAPNSRTTQMFINYGDNARLDNQGFAPFGRVIKGMDVVEKINPKHSEDPDQELMQVQGNAYLKANFPDLDYIKSIKLLK
jgi:peptidyl-prolyl cis-trans isomerase A (cyclophilin A)